MITIVGANIFLFLNNFSAEPHSPPQSTSKGEDEKLETPDKPNEAEDNAYSVPLDVLQSISKNFEKLQADFEKTTTPDENRKIRIKSIRTVPPDADIEDVETPEGKIYKLHKGSLSEDNTP